MNNKSELVGFLEGTLAELEKLTKQIRETAEYSKSNECLFLLQELIEEQIRGQNENSSHSTHAVR